MFRKILFLCLILQITACDQLKDIAGDVLTTDGPLTSAEIAGGLKQALEIGIGKGSDRLSSVDGYFKSQYKILLPEEVRKVTEKLQKVPGFSQVENELLKLINRGAEDAAKSAKPIFVNAIKGMTFNDALNILMGENTAATNYLNQATYNQLYGSFQPKVVNSLDRVNATKYWNDAVTAYNRIPFVKKLNPKLDDYVTTEALKGLFSMVEKEEIAIRSDVSKRTTDLLKKVFAKQD
ncbi:MAG: DUF4197 domain-containing protein [Bacteroidota bacterium]